MVGMSRGSSRLGELLGHSANLRARMGSLSRDCIAGSWLWEEAEQELRVPKPRLVGTWPSLQKG